MKAQHHLAAVDVEAIFTLEHYLLRCDELFRWKVRRQSLGREYLAPLRCDAVRHRRSGCA